MTPQQKKMFELVLMGFAVAFLQSINPSKIEYKESWLLSNMTLEQLEEYKQKMIITENYEVCQQIQQEIDKRKIANKK